MILLCPFIFSFCSFSPPILLSPFFQPLPEAPDLNPQERQLSLVKKSETLLLSRVNLDFPSFWRLFVCFCIVGLFFLICPFRLPNCQWPPSPRWPFPIFGVMEDDPFLYPLVIDLKVLRSSLPPGWGFTALGAKSTNITRK